MPKALAALLAFLCSFASAAIAQTPVTGCFELVTDGILTADLDCTGLDAAALRIARKGTLDLAGFTLTGGDTQGVLCEGGCTINGNGGKITGAAYGAILSLSGTVVVRDLTLENNGGAGVNAPTIDAENLTTTGNDVGVQAARIDAENVTATNNDVGVKVDRKASIRNSVLSFNGWAVAGTGRTRVIVEGSTFEYNGLGFGKVRRATLLSSSVLNSGGSGIAAAIVRVENSTVTGSGTYPNCDPESCPDIGAYRLRAINVTCGTSSRWDYPGGFSSGETWGVCAND